MKPLNLIILCFLLAILSSCKKDPTSPTNQIIGIPNGDFEQWTNAPTLVNWQTNSCPMCVPPINEYVVVKDSLAYHGKYAAKFITNGWAKSKFAISTHPTFLTGYINSKITPGDTAKIFIDIFYNKQVVDSGKLYKTSSTENYKEFKISITNNSIKADSAEITIIGGGKQNTEITIDYLTLIKQ